MYAISAAVSLLLMLYGGYFAAVSILGYCKKARPNPQAAPTKRIACLIPARNEARVIDRLVQSLLLQRYPRELFDVYVLINNCSDDTAQRAAQAGAQVIVCDEHQRMHSKGEVLRFAFDRLLPKGRYDAFCVFDADNLADGGFLQAANNALHNGYHIAQAYRDSKNPDANWVAGCSASFFWLMSRLYNFTRANLGMTASLNGTGIVMSAELIADVGYDVTTLTEDQEYTAQCVLKGYKIGWMDDAIIYDEQPTALKDSFVQRRRWGAGNMQSSRKYLIPLIKKAVREKNRDALDLAVLFTGMYVQAISLLPVILTISQLIVEIRHDPAAGLHMALGAGVASLLAGMLFGVAFVFVITAMEKKASKVTTSSYFLMWLYLLSWMPANLLSLFTRPPKWVAIEHTNALSIDECVLNAAPPEGAPKKLHESKETSV